MSAVALPATQTPVGTLAGSPAEDVAAALATIERLQKRLARERAARLEAETLAEQGLRDLYVQKQRALLLERLASRANHVPVVEDVVRFALAEICEHTRFSLGHIYFVVEGRLETGNIWHLADEFQAEALAPFRLASKTLSFAPGEGLPGRVLVSGAPLWVVELASDEAFPRRQVAGECGLRTGFALPVLVGAEVAAVLEFFSLETSAAEDELLHCLKQIGEHLGRVIERRRAEERLLHDATHDALTGLPNRVLFTDRLDQAVERHRHDASASYAVMFIDLDRFKLVNDSLGHAAGDRLLTAVAHRLTAVLRRETSGHCTLARLGGDEFTILIIAEDAPRTAERVASEIQAAMRLPISFETEDLFSSASIGIASCEMGYASAADIMRDADIAMYRAKENGRSCTEIFSAEQHMAAMERLRLETALRRALREREFVLAYQPIVDLSQNRTTGFEALLRWRQADGRLAGPAEFLDIAEETGLILFIGLWVLREACFAAMRIAAPDGKPVTMSVNVSPRQFAQPDFADQVRQALADSGLPPARLRLEITESVRIAADATTMGVLSVLRAEGVKVAIDDFGTGYSSLSYLHQLPVDILKVDRAFVARLKNAPEAGETIRTIVSLAHAMGIEVVAEGTEVRGEVEAVGRYGCDFAQGYYFARPMGETEIEAFLTQPMPDALEASSERLRRRDRDVSAAGRCGPSCGAMRGSG